MDWDVPSGHKLEMSVQMAGRQRAQKKLFVELIGRGGGGGKGTPWN